MHLCIDLISLKHHVYLLYACKAYALMTIYLTDRLQYCNYVVFLQKYTYVDYFRQYRLYCVIYVAMTVN